MATKTRDPEAFWVVDAGNSLLKDMVIGGIGKENVITHALQQLSPASYAAMVHRAKYQPQTTRNSIVFEKNGLPYVVGDMALQSGTVKRVTGAGKYVAGYWDVVISAMMLRRWPEGHNNLTVAIAHPPDAIPYVDQMLDLIGGKHVLKNVEGKEITFVVREISPFDEPAGGLLRFMSLPGQEYNPHSIAPGQRLLVADCGGKISSLTPVMVGDNMRLEPLYESAAVFDLGIQNVIDTFKVELKSLYPNEFKGFRSIPDNMLQEGLRTRSITLANEVFAVEQAVLNSVARLLDELQLVYHDSMAGGRNFNHIVVSGGGGGLLFDFLANPKDGIFQHRYTHMADFAQNIHLATVRGGAEAFKIWLTRRAQMAGKH
jgi:hypothetical protein